MKTENQNKLFCELAGLNELPKNVQFNASETWTKLEQQLEPKKRTKPYWLWFAASAIIILAITFFNSNTDEKINSIAIKNDSKPTHQLINKAKPEVINKEVIKKINKKPSKSLEEIIPIENIVLENKMDTIQPIIAEQKITIIPQQIIVVAKPIRKKLKVVYASDLYEENNQQTAQQELAKEQPRKSFFKLFESQNKESEEASTTENQPQTNKTFLGFKSKPTATISINENQ